MSDLIDRQAAIDAIQKDRETGWKDSEDDVAYRNACDDGYAYAMQIISELPTVDAVEVVRCKDCKFFVSDMEWCEADDEHPTMPDAFCSWAERRDG